MQQYLPLAVLKRNIFNCINDNVEYVATVLTACGIETRRHLSSQDNIIAQVATVLTACGIETAVTKVILFHVFTLQQYLPLAVLKHNGGILFLVGEYFSVATVLTACGIETNRYLSMNVYRPPRCNSTYRLRY